MSYEFLDDMFERLLVTEGKTFGEAFEAIINERVEIMRDLGRVENAYQLFRKRHPKLPDNFFRNISSEPDRQITNCVLNYFIGHNDNNSSKQMELGQKSDDCNNQWPCIMPTFN